MNISKRWNKLKLELIVSRPVQEILDWEGNVHKEYQCLSIVGSTPYSCGQILPEAKELALKLNCPKLHRIIEIWEEWHCNDMTPGSRRQMEAVAHVPAKNWYENCLTHLREIGLEVDNSFPEPYTFGSRWLLKPIPEQIVEEALYLVSSDNDKRFGCMG